MGEKPDMWQNYPSVPEGDQQLDLGDSKSFGDIGFDDDGSTVSHVPLQVFPCLIKKFDTITLSV